jgi:carbonic anhydrase/acetyltransferase-like protein (isoleucine patch superfamily)
MKKKFLVFLGGIKFEFNTLLQLQKESKKYGISIGNDASIGDRASIGDDASIGDRASIGDDASIGYRASIGDDASILIRARIKASWSITKITHLINEYKYHVSGFVVDGEIIIQMGCFTRSLKEWENDFWNNNNEFREGTPEGDDRLRAFNKIKSIMNKEAP